MTKYFDKSNKFYHIVRFINSAKMFEKTYMRIVDFIAYTAVST